MRGNDPSGIRPSRAAWAESCGGSTASKFARGFQSRVGVPFFPSSPIAEMRNLRRKFADCAIDSFSMVDRRLLNGFISKKKELVSPQCRVTVLEYTELTNKCWKKSYIRSGLSSNF